MDNVKILEIKQSVYENNDKRAESIRKEMKEQGTFLLNLMSSPGSGKTSTVVKTIGALGDVLKIGVLEADIDSDVDAFAVKKAGAKVIQMHTGGMCHLNADMTRQGLESLDTEGLDFVIIENIGNLICPAEFDTGAAKNAMILSVPEGDDKPLKYPSMFSKVDVVLINKIDAISFFDFDMDAVKERIEKLNPGIKVIPMSAKTGEGMGEWFDWIRTAVKEWKE